MRYDNLSVYGIGLMLSENINSMLILVFILMFIRKKCFSFRFFVMDMNET